MLQKISYFNLMYAATYSIIYFRDNTINSTVGILMIILINWLALKSNQIENYRWTYLHYVSGLWSLYYIGFLLYGNFNIIFNIIEYHFASFDTMLFIVLSLILSLFVLIQLVLYFLKNKSD